jgi:hypothetical protein
VRAEPRASCTRRVGIICNTGGRDLKPFDLGKEDLRERRDGPGSVGENAPQPLGHRDHPAPHGHRRDDVIDEVGGGLGHVASVAGRADAAVRHQPIATLVSQNTNRGHARAAAACSYGSHVILARLGPVAR